MDLWCSGPTCLPVTEKIEGSNPSRSASYADVVQWKNLSHPSWLCEFDSRRLLHWVKANPGITWIFCLFGSYFDLFQCANTFMHLLTPILSVLGFLLFERNRKMNMCWSLLPLSSVFIYGIYYLIQLFIHDSFGKSEYDWYGFTTSPIFWSFFLLAMIGASYLVSLGLFYASGSHMRKEKTKV